MCTSQSRIQPNSPVAVTGSLRLHARRGLKVAEWPKGKKFPSIEVHPSKARARFNADLELSCELPWFVSLFVVHQFMRKNGKEG